MKDETASKLVAFIGYHVGDESRDPRVTIKTRSEMIDDAIRFREMLQKLPVTKSNLRRQILFTMILAEINRHSDNFEHRVEAQALSEVLESQGGGNPFNYYMQIVELTSDKPNSGNFGDIGVSGTASIRYVDGGRYYEYYCEIDEKIKSFFRPSEIHQVLSLSTNEAKHFNTFLGKSIRDLAAHFKLQP